MSSIPGRAARVPAPVLAEVSSFLPSCVRVEKRGRRRGQVLVAARAFAAGEIILQEAPLAALPPFDARVSWEAAAGGSGKNSGWAAVESLVQALHFRDDALVLYRAVLLYYLLHLSPEARSAAGASHAIAQRILRLYDPSRPTKEDEEDDAAAQQQADEDEDCEVISTSGAASASGSSHRSKRHRMVSVQSELVASVRTDSGRIALQELFACVAAQAESNLGVPIARVNVRPSSSGDDAASFDDEHFLSHIQPLAQIFNVNNMDCVAGLGAPAAAAATASGDDDAAASASGTYTAVYDAISRLNHACLPRCVHYLEQEEAYQQGLGRIGATVTPQKLALSSSAPSASASSSSAAAPAGPHFVRTLRALCAIREGQELTISYLSPQLLCQSTQRRQAHLQKHWKFLCRCGRCSALDTARVFKCPTCGVGSVLVQPLTFASPSALRNEQEEQEDLGEERRYDEDDNDAEPCFALVSTCPCETLGGSESSALLSGEKIAEDEWARFQAALGSCKAPGQLCDLFASLLDRHHIAESHWVRFEFGLVQRDLQTMVHRNNIAAMELQKKTIWFLERVFSRSLAFDVDTLLAMDPRSTAALAAKGKSFGDYSHESLLIDPMSSRFVPVGARLAGLCLTVEHRDAWDTYADLLWTIHASQPGDLARMVMARSLYFLACALGAARALTPAHSQTLGNIQKKMAQRIGIAKLKQVDLSKLLEDQTTLTTPSPAATAVTSSAAASSSSPSVAAAPAPSSSAAASPAPLICHSPVCPANAFSSAPPVAALICTRCRSVRYCSQRCQRADWKLHKPACKAPQS